MKCTKKGVRIKCKGKKEILKLLNATCMQEKELSELEFPIDLMHIINDPQTQDLILGNDDRVELFEAKDEIQSNAMKAAAFIYHEYISNDNKIRHSGCYTEKEPGYHLSPCEPFYGQKEAAYATAIAIDKKTFVTAGHIVKEGIKKDDFKLVFGFWKSTILDDPLKIIKSYSIEKWGKSDSFDLAFIKTKEEIDSKFIASFDSNPKSYYPQDDTKVYAAGYPGNNSPGNSNRIYLKVIQDGRTKKGNSKSGEFQASLDVFKGNSGSPLFNQKDHQFIGIAIRHNQINYEEITCGWISCYTEEEEMGVWPTVISLKTILEEKSKIQYKLK